MPRKKKIIEAASIPVPETTEVEPQARPEPVAPAPLREEAAHTVLITGAAGYVGAMLVDRLAKRRDVARIIGIDMEPLPEFIKDVEKLTYIEQNLADTGWEEQVLALRPDVIIHTAWHIREIYGNRPLTWKWNVTASDRVFDFAFQNAGVKRLIHFSTVASYGAFESNRTDYLFTEQDPFRKTEYLYAEEKRVAEEHLRKRYAGRANEGIAVSVLRPAAITGPRGRFQRIRFGLQSALSGSLSGEKSLAYRIISLLVSRIPATPKWLRQFIHEDDVAGITERLAFGEPAGTYEVFNICPPGSAVRAADMARAVGKKVLPVPPWIMRIGNFFAWHLSRGKIPTAKGAWKSYSYPIAVDGSKVTRELGYEYQYSSLDAFQYTDGEYESFVPESLRLSNKQS